MTENLPLYHPVKIGCLEIPGNIFLSPMAGYSDVACRSMALDGGADLAYTEMISAEALLRNNSRTLKMLRRASNERTLAVQLFGSNPESLGSAAKIAAEMGADFLDLNAGCPVPKVTRGGSGAALGKNVNLLGRLINAMRGSGLPVTVKIRSGWNQNQLNWREAALAAIDAGAAAIGFHPRTQQQLYGGNADWQLLSELVNISSVPVIGSGDLWNPEAALNMLQSTGCDAVMFARAAVGNPNIFIQTRNLLINGQNPGSQNPAGRIKLAELHLRRAIHAFGEDIASKTIRKHLAKYVGSSKRASELRYQLTTADNTDAMFRILEAEFDESCGNAGSM